MKHPLFPLAVVMRRVPVTNRWISEKWVLDAVEASGPSDEISCAEAGENAWRWQGFALDLHPSEAEGYHLNLTAPDPRVFVMWRLEEFQGVETARPWVTTASYHEAARMMDSGETVDSVQMPADVRAWIEPWVTEHYKPEPRKKHKRNEKFWGQGQPAPAPEPQLVSEPNSVLEPAARSVSEPERAAREGTGSGGPDVGRSGQQLVSESVSESQMSDRTGAASEPDPRHPDDGGPRP